MFDAMPRAKVLPDVITFNAAISSCGRTGRWDLALALFDSMRKKLQPSIITINAMLAAYAKAEQRQKALDLMEAAPEAGRRVRNLRMR